MNKDNTGIIIAGGILALFVVWLMSNFLGKMSAAKTQFVASGDIDNTLNNLGKLQNAGVGVGVGGYAPGVGVNSGNTNAYQNGNSGQIVNQGTNAYDALIAQTQALGATLTGLSSSLADQYHYGY